MTQRILVIDDDPGTSTVVRSWFKGEPYEILAAENGERGLTMARAERPDVILLDLKMPGMDGISVARELKNDPLTRNTPVLVLTACRDVDAKVEAFNAGTDDYVTKPFEFEEVDARIRSMLKRRDALVGLEATVEELNDTNAQLEQLLMIDEKTGLYNFREFRHRLRAEWSRAARYETPLSLVFLDIDDFKKLNDTLGHAAGDRILAEFATLVTGGARANDVAARYGGEEFSIVLPHTDGEMALRVAERIRRAVAEFTFIADERPTRITVSAGVATYPSTAGLSTVDDLVRAADLAMYRAKDRGKNCVVRA
ncbi:MAG TPA: diguanylate cyclase [Candidatus Polarisedimenticolaceae bacterium]|nr:diguanylate cyclase [Candidatus Polarisedimenticolaceae bacterium]